MYDNKVKLPTKKGKNNANKGNCAPVNMQYSTPQEVQNETPQEIALSLFKLDYDPARVYEEIFFLAWELAEQGKCIPITLFQNVTAAQSLHESLK